MVRHIVMWNFKGEFPKEKREALAEEARGRFAALVGQIKGLVSAEIHLNSLPGSTHDMMLVTDLETAEDLQGYQASPLHQAVANELVRPNTCNRACFDYLLD